MKKKSILRNIIITLLALVAACVISFIFQRLEVQEHITTIFVFSVFIVSLFTDGYFYGIFSSVVGTVAINFAFTYPFLEFDFITPVNVISAIIKNCDIADSYPCKPFFESKDCLGIRHLIRKLCHNNILLCSFSEHKILNNVKFYVLVHIITYFRLKVNTLKQINL